MVPSTRMGSIIQLLFLLALTITVIRTHSSSDCTEADCKAFVNSIKNSINTQVNPCDDFYEYACGKWEENNPIPPDVNIWNALYRLEKHLRERVIEIFNDDVGTSNSTEAFRRAKKMYQNCINLVQLFRENSVEFRIIQGEIENSDHFGSEYQGAIENSKAIEKNGVGTVLSQIRKTGGWPTIMTSNTSTLRGQTLHEMHAYYMKTLNLPLLYDFNVYPDLENSTVRYLQIDALFIPPFQFLLQANSRNSSKVSQWIGNITDFVKLLAHESGNDVNIEDIKNDINDVIDFEYSLLRIMNAKERPMKGSERDALMTINDFQKWYNSHSHSENSKIIWIDFLRDLFNNTRVHFNETDTIKIVRPSYVVNVIKLLDSTPIRIIVNYIQLNSLSVFIHGLPKKWRDIAFNLKHIITGVEVQSHREELCVQLMGFEHATSYEYVKRYVHPNTKQSVNEIITNLSSAANKILNQTSWLKSDEVAFINRKLSAMRRFIAYPDWYQRPSAMDNYYQQCIISDNFLENLIEVRRFARYLLFNELIEPADENKMDIVPIELNAYYLVESNAIAFSAALLQPPLFSESFPRLFQYATLGILAGHEISHAFDSEGSRFDEEGEAINWLSMTTKYKFDSKVKCFVRQFSEYKTYVTGNETIHVDGEHTKDENIGDLSGLTFAYQAYQNIRTSEDVNLRLPGLESYTDEQLFFLAFTNIWCSSVRPTFYKNEAVLDPHSVPKFRIIGTLSNMNGFSKAFNCPANSTMNPSNKCIIWGSSI